MYVGVTEDLVKRIYEHQNKLYKKSFSSKYNLDTLLYWESFEDINNAIDKEKQVKNWRRDWKINLIKTTNPDLIDLSELDGCAIPSDEGILKRVQDDGV